MLQKTVECSVDSHVSLENELTKHSQHCSLATVKTVKKPLYRFLCHHPLITQFSFDGNSWSSAKAQTTASGSSSLLKASFNSNKDKMTNVVGMWFINVKNFT